MPCGPWTFRAVSSGEELGTSVNGAFEQRFALSREHRDRRDGHGVSDSADALLNLARALAAAGTANDTIDLVGVELSRCLSNRVTELATVE